MAPDIDSIRWSGYDAPSEYNVPDIIYDDPNNRPLKALSIGCGVSGIMMAYKIQKECQNVEVVMYDKNPDIGGTWFENRYPNAACDVPSHAYTYNFALYPDWPAYFAKSESIWNYLDKVCEVFGLRKFMNFNSRIVKAEWSEDAGKWEVTIDQTQPDGQVKRIEESCDVLLHATGILNRKKWPNINGLDTFKGRIVHTSEWPKEYQEEQWKEDKVAVIGSGASSIQTVPGMQPHVKHMDIYIRTGVWFVSIADNYGQNHIYTQDHKKQFQKSPESLVKHAKYIEDSINSIFEVMFTGTEAQKVGQETFSKRMAEHLKDKRLLEGFTPKFGLGCRRITPGDPYMKAIQEPNVDVHFVAVDRLTEKGVVDSEGVEREVDTVVCATGFDTTYRPHFPIIGKNGTDLAEKWKVVPESYFGLTIPEMPNFITFIGPTWPVENGSVMGPLTAVSDYAITAIKKLQREHIKSFAPKQDVTDAFNNHTQEWIKKTVWSEDCRSWYRNNETGRVNAVYPGSSLHYIEILQHPRWEDYEFEYQDQSGGKNMWEFLGRGLTVAEQTPGMDRSPYLNQDVVDPEWKRQVWKQKYVPENKDEEIRLLKERVRQLEAEQTNVGGP